MRTRHSTNAWVAGVAIAAAACLAVPTTARADGKAFHTSVPNLSMPDQQAIITWKDGVETLVISTAIDMPAGGPDAKAAWVIPLPTQGRVPETFPVEPGVFDAARAACTPRFAHVPFPLAPALFALGILVWLTVLLPKRRSLIIRTGAVVLTLLAILEMWPKLGVTRSASGPAPSGVHILDARRVGSYDTVTLSSTDPGELVRWLNDHGFNVDPKIAPVIAQHVAEQWVFVVCRLTADVAGSLAGRVEPHPLGFRFATAAPIYPLRLTGVGNTDLDVDLFVFGDGTAEAPGFRVARSGPVDTSPRAGLWGIDGAVRVSQPELGALAAGSPRLTRLSGTLTPADMTRDAKIEFSAPRDRGGVVHSTESADRLGASAAGSVLLLLGVGAVFARIPSRASDNRRAAWFLAAAAITGATGIAVASTLETLPARPRGRFGVGNTLALYENVAESLARSDGAPRTLDELRRAARALHAQEAPGVPAPVEGVGPLQWRIAPASTPAVGFVYEYRDVYGAPVRVRVR